MLLYDADWMKRYGFCDKQQVWDRLCWSGQQRDDLVCGGRTWTFHRLKKFIMTVVVIVGVAMGMQSVYSTATPWKNLFLVEPWLFWELKLQVIANKMKPHGAAQQRLWTSVQEQVSTVGSNNSPYNGRQPRAWGNCDGLFAAIVGARKLGTFASCDRVQSWTVYLVSRLKFWKTCQIIW